MASINYGEFAPFCKNVPSLAICNVFFVRLLQEGHLDLLGVPIPASLTSQPGFNASNASLPLSNPMIQELVAGVGVGVNSTCSIPKIGHNGSHGNFALAIAAPLCTVFTLFLWLRIHQRIAAVGRSEMMIFFGTYAATMIPAVLSSGSFLQQASPFLLVCTAIQAGLLSAMYGALLQCAIVETQLVEDGTMGSLLPTWIFWFVNCISTAFTHLDTAYGWTKALGLEKHAPNTLKNNSMFTSDFLMPTITITVVSLIKCWVCIGLLGEWRPLVWNLISGALWGASQVTTFTISGMLCRGSGAKIDGAFVSMILQTASLWALYHAWTLSTEESFPEDVDLSYEKEQYDGGSGRNIKEDLSCVEEKFGAMTTFGSSAHYKHSGEYDDDGSATLVHHHHLHHQRPAIPHLSYPAPALSYHN